MFTPGSFSRKCWSTIVCSPTQQSIAISQQQSRLIRCNYSAYVSFWCFLSRGSWRMNIKEAHQEVSDLSFMCEPTNIQHLLWWEIFWQLGHQSSHEFSFVFFSVFITFVGLFRCSMCNYVPFGKLKLKGLNSCLVVSQNNREWTKTAKLRTIDWKQWTDRSSNAPQSRSKLESWMIILVSSHYT